MSERKHSSDEIVPGRDLGKVSFGIVSLRLGILEMIADFQGKAAGHRISIFAGSKKALQQNNDALWFGCRFHGSLFTILHSPVAAQQPGQLQVAYGLKTNGGPLTRIPLRSTVTSTVSAILTKGIPS